MGSGEPAGLLGVDEPLRYRHAAVTTFAVKFLGCKVSQADAMLARAALLAAGHDEAPEEEAELHVINTCCITQRGGGEVAPVGAPLVQRPPTAGVSSRAARRT